MTAHWKALAVLATISIAASAQPLAGIWEARIQGEQVEIAFTIEFAQSGGSIRAAFFNGDQRVESTAGTINDGVVSVSWDHYGSRLEATLEDGVLKGKYGSARSGVRDFDARPASHRNENERVEAPMISGVWEIPTETAKGERAWRLIVRQSGPDVTAAILRVDGDTGAMRGQWQGDRFRASIFDGARGSSMEITPQPDGTLRIDLTALRGQARRLTAIRPAEARSKGLPEPTDPEQHTAVRNPDEPFAFSFPDMTGKVVSNTDAKFEGKVLLINITGSWCPNCHDEAPFLQELYRKYRSLGLEVIAISFEEADELKTYKRLPAFLRKYGIEYTYLVGGEPSELQQKIPHAVNLNASPTTFITGRDGRVRAVHAGFAAPASGEYHSRLKEQFARTIEELLAETRESQ